MRIHMQEVEFEINGKTLLYPFTHNFSTGIVNVIGKNGAGKSTLLKILATAQLPTKGKITYSQLIEERGVGLYRKTLSLEEVRKVISFLPQEFTGYPEMTIERYLRFMAYHKGIPRSMIKKEIHQWLTETGLYALRKRKLRDLSGGQLKKVGLIQALLNYPRICILDEPFESLDIEERLFFQKWLTRLSFHSIIIISTHIINEIQEGEILLVDSGKVAVYKNLEEASTVKF